MGHIDVVPLRNHNETIPATQRRIPMPAFTVKNIPDKLYERLKAAAMAHHRSINGEVIACLDRVLSPQQLTNEEHLEIAQALRNRVRATSPSIEEINEAKQEGRP